MDVLKFNTSLFNETPNRKIKLKSGETLTVFCEDYNDREIIEYLTGLKKNENIKLNKRFYRVEDVRYKSSLINQIFKRYLVRNYLKHRIKCNDSRAKELLERINIGYNWDMNLAGNSRRLLSLIIAFELNDCIIYSTEALDSEGILNAHRLVREIVKEENKCAIEINYFENIDKNDFILNFKNKIKITKV